MCPSKISRYGIKSTSSYNYILVRYTHDYFEDTSFGSFLVHDSVATLLTTNRIPRLHLILTVTFCVCGWCGWRGCVCVCVCIPPQIYVMGCLDWLGGALGLGVAPPDAAGVPGSILIY